MRKHYENAIIKDAMHTKMHGLTVQAMFSFKSHYYSSNGC